jgi:hypothetical protein
MFKGAVVTAALALALGAAPVPAFSATSAIPTEQSDDQTQTLSGAQSGLYRTLEGWSAGAMPVMQMSQRISQDIDKEPTHLSLALAWTKDRVSVKDMAKVNSLYFLIYADMAARSALGVPPNSPYYMAYLKAAYQALSTFELMFKADAARCVNPAAGAPLDGLLQSRYTALKHVFDTATPDEMDTYWTTALKYEAASTARPGNAEICSNGVAEALAVDAGQTPPERVDASYIDDAKWAPLRDKIRADTSAKWKAAYAPIGKAWLDKKAKSDAAKALAEENKKQQAEAAAAAKQKAAEAAAAQQKAAEEAAAKEKQDRLNVQKKEQGKYSDTYVPEPSTGLEDSGGGGGD